MDASQLVTVLTFLLVIGALIFVGDARDHGRQERLERRQGVRVRPKVVSIKEIIDRRVRERRRGSAA